MIIAAGVQVALFALGIAAYAGGGWWCLSMTSIGYCLGALIVLTYPK